MKKILLIFTLLLTSIIYSQGISYSAISNDYLNIKDYGAVGDGSKDDTQSIRDAIAAAATIKKPVWFPQGAYKVTSAINITSSVVLIGAGKFKTAIVNYTANNNVFVIEYDMVTIKDLNIQQSATVTATAGAAIVVGLSKTQRNWLLVENVILQRSYKGIELVNANDCKFLNVDFSLIENTCVDMHNVNPSGDNIFDNIIMSATDSSNAYGFYIRSADVSFYSNVKILNHKYPIYAVSDTGNINKQFFNNLSIEGNNGTELIHLAKGTGYVTSEIEICGGNLGTNTNDNTTSINILDSVTNVSIKGIVFSSIGTTSGCNGIKSSGQRINIIGNIFTGIKGNGISLGATSLYNTINSNTINSNSNYGISLDDSTNYFSITGNSFYDNTTGTIYYFNANVKSYNIIDNNSGDSSSFLKLDASRTYNIATSLSAADIQLIIDAQPKNLNGFNLIFQLADGTHTWTSGITFSSFYNGLIVIRGNSSETNTLHTNQAVTIQSSSNIAKLITFNLCQKAEVRYIHFNFTGVTLYNIVIQGAQSNMGIYGNYFQDDGNKVIAINAQTFSNFRIMNNYFNKTDTALLSELSFCISQASTTQTNQQTVGLDARDGSTIAKNDVQPTAATAESTATGGVIR